MQKPITTIDDLAELMVRTMASKEDMKAMEGRLTARLDRSVSSLDGGGYHGASNTNRVELGAEKKVLSPMPPTYRLPPATQGA